MEISQIIPHIEALIFASEKPLSSVELTELVNNAMGFIEDRASQEQVDAAIEGICEKYNADFYPFEVRQSGGGWQFLTKKAYYKTVGQLNGDKFLKRLSNAALETLAIIAYKQPITKSEIEAIRGVNCDYAVQKLLEKELIVINGRREDAVGHPLVYGTSKSFMDYFGINTPEELPQISEVMMDELVKATMVTPLGEMEMEQETTVSDEAAASESSEVDGAVDAHELPHNTDADELPGNDEPGSDEENTPAMTSDDNDTDSAEPEAADTDEAGNGEDDRDNDTDTAEPEAADTDDMPGNGEPGSDEENA